MAKTNNGGPAFPGCVRNSPKKLIRHPGMALRDYFAGQALTGWLASFPPEYCGVNARKCAELAYELADAMIAARKGGDV